MKIEKTSNSGGQSRRNILMGVAIALGGGAVLAAELAASPAAANSKVAQKLVNYQSTPKGAARCDGCIQWQPPASCKVVAGAISPSGWCTIYAPKPKS